MVGLQLFGQLARVVPPAVLHGRLDVLGVVLVVVVLEAAVGLSLVVAQLQLLDRLDAVLPLGPHLENIR